jgi:hypothetical protein
MAIGTHKSNAEVHPGRILLESQPSRRTKQQIESDVSKAKAEAEAEAEAERQCAVLIHIAKLKHSAEQEEQAMHMHANRPDLHHSSRRGTTRLTLRIPRREMTNMCDSTVN